MLNQPITDEEAATLKAFNRWCRALFNAHIPFTRDAPFCCLPHHDASGNILINSGRMMLVMQPNTYAIYSLDEGERLMVACDGSLERALLDSLCHSINREFVATYGL